MTTWYAIHGQHSGDLLTVGGRPLVHDNRYELEFLLPNAIVVRVTERELKARSPLEPLPLREHPELQHLRWPLRRRDFR